MSPEENHSFAKHMDEESQRFKGILELLDRMAQGTTTREDRDRLANALVIDPRQGRK